MAAAGAADSITRVSRAQSLTGPAANRRGVRWLRALRDALRLGTAIALAPFSGRAVRARGAEAALPLPGDELLPRARGQWTNAITIRARPTDIWPWLVAYDTRAVGLGLHLLGHPLHSAMQRRQLLTLKRRIEGFAAARRG